MKNISILFFCLFCMLFITKSFADEKGKVLVKTQEVPKLGVILTDSKGMTLYIFTPDKAAMTSSCLDECAALWPPLLSDLEYPLLEQGVEGELGTIIRQDEKRQATYNDMPLYYYAKDSKPGDIFGDKVEDTWFVVHPKAFSDQ